MRALQLQEATDYLCVCALQLQEATLGLSEFKEIHERVAHLRLAVQQQERAEEDLIQVAMEEAAEAAAKEEQQDAAEAAAAKAKVPVVTVPVTRLNLATLSPSLHPLLSPMRSPHPLLNSEPVPPVFSARADGSHTGSPSRKSVRTPVATRLASKGPIVYRGPPPPSVRSLGKPAGGKSTPRAVRPKPQAHFTEEFASFGLPK